MTVLVLHKKMYLKRVGNGYSVVGDLKSLGTSKKPPYPTTKGRGIGLDRLPM